MPFCSVSRYFFERGIGFLPPGDRSRHAYIYPPLHPSSDTSTVENLSLAPYTGSNRKQAQHRTGARPPNGGGQGDRAAVQAPSPLQRRCVCFASWYSESAECSSSVVCGFCVGTRAGSSPLVLGLGLGLAGDSSGERDAEAAASATAARSALTFMQHLELEHQVLIYRYFAAGAPVPVHLVLPIWKSLAASSFGPQRFPSRTVPRSSIWQEFLPLRRVTGVPVWRTNKALFL
jgi:hypothetical protein